MASNSVISLGIQVDGENTFKSALSAIDAEIKSLGAGVEAATASMAQMGESEEAAAKKSELLGKQVEANEKKLAILSQQYDAANKRLGDLGKALEEAKKSGDPAAIDKATIAYNKQAGVVSNLSARMSKTETAIAKTKQEMAANGETTEKTSSRWDRFKESLGNFPSAAQSLALQNVSKGLEGINNAIDSVLGKLKDFGLALWNAGKDASVMADDLLTLSSTTNVSAENLQKWEYASRFIDTSVDTLTGSLSKLTKNMASQSTATQEAFQRLGVSVTDSSGKYRTAEAVMWDAIDALKGVENQTERDNLAMSLFGKSASELNPIIQSGTAAFREMGDEAQAAGLILSDQGLNALGTFNDSLQQMDATFAGVKNQIMAALAPAFTTIAEKITDVAGKIAAWVQTDEAQEMFANIAESVMVLVESLAENLEPIINTIIGGFRTVGNVIKWVSENSDLLITAIITLTAVIVALKVAQIALNVAMAANPIGAIISLVVALVAAVVGAVVIIIKNWESIWGAIKQGIEVIKNAFAKVFEFISGIIRSVIDAFRGMIDGMLNIGRNLVEGLWKGISGAASWLWEQLTGWAKGIVNGIKGLVGIHSPSTLMRDQVGRMLGLGVAEGIADSAGAVQKAYDNLMPSPALLTASVDGYSVAARVADQQGGPSPFQDNRPIILTLNDRELGRAVRGYV